MGLHPQNAHFAERSWVTEARVICGNDFESGEFIPDSITHALWPQPHWLDNQPEAQPAIERDRSHSADLVEDSRNSHLQGRTPEADHTVERALVQSAHVI